jgi:hypothetical protein
MKTSCVPLLILALSPIAFAQAPITGKLVKIVLGNSESDAATVSKILDLSSESSINVEEKSENTNGSKQAAA